MTSDALQTTLEFVNRINHADTQGLIDLLASEHTFIDIQGEVEDDTSRIAQGWENYLTSYPDYHIFIRRIFKARDEIILIGHTTGSHLELPEAEEFHAEGVIWVASVDKGKLTSWGLYNDTMENYEQLGLDQSQEIFEPAWIASTIAKHLDLLPVESRTQDVRNVRKYYSRLYRHASPQTMVAIGEHLLFDQGYRLVPYELIYYHPGALETLDIEQVLALGKGIKDWSSTDIYAHFIAGPAWKKGVISDEVIQMWIQSTDLWWRRAAVVSTIYLFGDVERMLTYSEMLVDDKEEPIVKALSWVLREASRYDPQAVADFLRTHETRLAARIKREVKNKLETGVKIP